VGEALTSILKKNCRDGCITPIKVARGAPGVYNLLFADDSLLFFKATAEEARAVDSCLKLFQRGTGQRLSPNKCSILFTDVCLEATQAVIKGILCVSTATFEEKYLGFPTPEGRMKDGSFQPIMARFGKRLTSWDERLMSHAAKDTLIKSVAQALPSHIMSIFKLSIGFCEQYERLIREFWWGDDKNQRRVHWTTWDNLTKPKHNGGMGFRDMHLFNQAILARFAWRLLQKPDCLCARVLKAKYFPHGNLLDTVFATDPSPVWRGIEFGIELLKQGIIKRIGDGRSTQFVRDQWLPRESGMKISALRKNTRKRWVNQLIHEETNTWNTDILRELFYDHDVQTITNIELPNSPQPDRFVWHLEKNGLFTVRSAYRLAFNLKHQHRDNATSSSGTVGNRPIWKAIWSAKVQPKIRVFGW
jgi:hypothetical protein